MAESVGVAEERDADGKGPIKIALARAGGKENVPIGEHLKDYKKNRIQVSNRNNTLSFYLNLSKKYLKQYGDIELCGLGRAIPTVVTISEILKKEGSAAEKEILISSIRSEKGDNGRVILKAKIQILMKADKLDDTTNTVPKEDC